jgi:hypothetical protein
MNLSEIREISRMSLDTLIFLNGVRSVLIGSRYQNFRYCMNWLSATHESFLYSFCRVFEVHLGHINFFASYATNSFSRRTELVVGWLVGYSSVGYLVSFYLFIYLVVS